MLAGGKNAGPGWKYQCASVTSSAARFQAQAAAQERTASSRTDRDSAKKNRAMVARDDPCTAVLQRQSRSSIVADDATLRGGRPQPRPSDCRNGAAGGVVEP